MLITETGWTLRCDDVRVHLPTLVHLLSPCNFVATHEAQQMEKLNLCTAASVHSAHQSPS